MQTGTKLTYPIAYKWLSYVIVLAFVYYWLFTIAIIFLPKTINTTTPRQAAVYTAFIRQNWQLFAASKVYNRQLNVVLRDKITQQPTDTIDLVQYTIAEKRKQAPFNNYEDAIDHILYKEMNGLERQLAVKKKILQQQFPGRADSFYMQQSSLLLEQDSLQPNLHNLVNYAKYVLQQKKITTANKEFQLTEMHKYIQPQLPAYSIAGDSTAEPLFISTFKNL